MTTRTEALQGVWTMEPLDGDAGGIRRHASRYTRLAEKVGTAVTDLKRAIADAESHESEAMTELATQSDEVIPHLAAIQDRYETAGSALSTFADVLDQAQSDVTGAIAVRESTADTVSSYDAQITEAEHAMQRATIEELESRRDELTRLENAVQPLTQTLVEARTSYDGALAAVEEAGDVAQRKIDDAVDADGLTDSRWDTFKSWVTDNMSWIKILKDALSIIATALGVLSIFFPFLLPFAVAFAFATLLLSLTLATTGNGSWLDVGLDTVALLTLGVGAAIGSGVKSAAGALRVTRSARLAWSGAQRPGVFGTLLRPFRAAMQYGDEAVRVADDISRVLPDGMILEGIKLAGRPAYRSLDDVWRVFRGGGADGAAFAAAAQNARLGAGGLVDDAILGAGGALRNAGFTNNIVGVVGTGVSWHDDVINGGILGLGGGLREARGSAGDALRAYGDWWVEVDGATFDVAGAWDPAGRSK